MRFILSLGFALLSALPMLYANNTVTSVSGPPYSASWVQRISRWIVYDQNYGFIQEVSKEGEYDFLHPIISAFGSCTEASVAQLQTSQYWWTRFSAAVASKSLGIGDNLFQPLRINMPYGVRWTGSSPEFWPTSAFVCIDPDTPWPVPVTLRECSSETVLTRRRAFSVNGGAVTLRYTLKPSMTGQFKTLRKYLEARENFATDGRISVVAPIAPDVTEFLNFTIPADGLASNMATTIRAPVTNRLSSLTQFTHSDEEVQGSATGQAGPNSECNLQYTATTCNIALNTAPQFRLRGWAKLIKPNDLNTMWNLGGVFDDVAGDPLGSRVLLGLELKSTATSNYSVVCKPNAA
ncbi:hypothetical protein B0H13DRAFT_1861067 [Mycena leptocephala]|nr:hypothetical protein B0H13DRAFT_1861067 [Mycena leptocephala]